MTNVILSGHVYLEYFGSTEDYFLSFIGNLLFAAFLYFVNCLKLLGTCVVQFIHSLFYSLK